MDCVLKINSGAGGTWKPGLGFDADAHVYALNFSHMDTRRISDLQNGDEAGIKSADDRD